MGNSGRMNPEPPTTPIHPFCFVPKSRRLEVLGRRCAPCSHWRIPTRNLLVRAMRADWLLGHPGFNQLVEPTPPAGPFLHHSIVSGNHDTQHLPIESANRQGPAKPLFFSKRFPVSLPPPFFSRGSDAAKDCQSGSTKNTARPIDRRTANDKNRLARFQRLRQALLHTINPRATRPQNQVKLATDNKGRLRHHVHRLVSQTPDKQCRTGHRLFKISQLFRNIPRQPTGQPQQLLLDTAPIAVIMPRFTPCSLAIAHASLIRK